MVFNVVRHFFPQMNVYENNGGWGLGVKSWSKSIHMGEGEGSKTWCILVHVINGRPLIRKRLSAEFSQERKTIKKCNKTFGF